MAQTLNIGIALGSSKTGLNLRAQLFDNDGANVGSAVAAGFSERGGGAYHWHYEAFPDDFTGGVDFFDDDTDDFLAAASVNESDFGNSGDDPLEALVPGSYESGTAGAALGRIGTARITVTQPITVDLEMRITRGMDYYAADGRAFEWTDADSDIPWANLTGATVKWISGGLEYDCTVITPTGNKVVRLELTAAQSLAIKDKRGEYVVVATLASSLHKIDLARGVIQPLHPNGV